MSCYILIFSVSFNGHLALYCVVYAHDFFRKCHMFDNFRKKLLFCLLTFYCIEISISHNHNNLKNVYGSGHLHTPTLSILALSRMTLLKVSFSDILRNDYWDHFDTFGENCNFDTFKNA